MILATWYKMNLKESLLGQVYVDQNKIVGIDLENKNVKQEIYDQYVEAFSKGVYNYIREEYDPVTQEMIPRKYFSGGTAAVSSPIITVVSSLDELSVKDRALVNSPVNDKNLHVRTRIFEVGKEAKEANVALAVTEAEDFSRTASPVASSPVAAPYQEITSIESFFLATKSKEVEKGDRLRISFRDGTRDEIIEFKSIILVEADRGVGETTHPDDYYEIAGEHVIKVFIKMSEIGWLGKEIRSIKTTKSGFPELIVSEDTKDRVWFKILKPKFDPSNSIENRGSRELEDLLVENLDNHLDRRVQLANLIDKEYEFNIDSAIPLTWKTIDDVYDTVERIKTNKKFFKDVEEAIKLVGRTHAHPSGFDFKNDFKKLEEAVQVSSSSRLIPLN